MSTTTTAAAAARIQITIDGQPVTVARDSYLLPAAKSLGIEIPTLCHHKDLTPTGICRLCVCEVEVRGKKRLVTSYDPENCQIYIDEDRLAKLGLTLHDLSRFLESQPWMFAVFTNDEVRRAADASKTAASQRKQTEGRR